MRKLTVKIETLTSGSKGIYGDETETWSTLNTYKISTDCFYPISGNEIKFTDKDTVFANYRVNLPYNTTIQEKDRAIIDDVEYDIKFVRRYIDSHVILDLLEKIR
jgi:SPP1 family predicted phage head-tail adaptor